MSMTEKEFITVMESIAQSIRETGMKPYDQLYGYLTTGKEEYITRNGDARKLIKTLNWKQVWEYVEAMEEGK